jgi:hypothetical protein
MLAAGAMGAAGIGCAGIGAVRMTSGFVSGFGKVIGLAA